MTDCLKAKKRNVPVPLLFGVAFHDVYHAGQIRLLRRLWDLDFRRMAQRFGSISANSGAST